RIQLLELIEGVVGDAALTVGAALERGVVRHHELAVPGGVQVQLEHVGTPALDRSLERRERVLRGEQRPASVGDVEGRAQACEEGMAHGGPRVWALRPHPCSNIYECSGKTPVGRAGRKLGATPEGAGSACKHLKRKGE